MVVGPLGVYPSPLYVPDADEPPDYATPLGLFVPTPGQSGGLSDPSPYPSPRYVPEIDEPPDYATRLGSACQSAGCWTRILMTYSTSTPSTSIPSVTPLVLHLLQVPSEFPFRWCPVEAWSRGSKTSDGRWVLLSPRRFPLSGVRLLSSGRRAPRRRLTPGVGLSVMVSPVLSRLRFCRRLGAGARQTEIPSEPRPRGATDRRGVGVPLGRGLDWHPYS